MSFSFAAFIGQLFFLLPVVILAIVLRWIRFIKINSDTEVEQNKQIIELLTQINEKLEK